MDSMKKVLGVSLIIWSIVNIFFFPRIASFFEKDPQTEKLFQKVSKASIIFGVVLLVIGVFMLF